MKIQRLDIQGFRSLKKVSWKPGDLNVVIGPNGSGKSNLLLALDIMSNSVRGRLSRYIQSVGGMESLLWDGQVSNLVFHLESITSSPSPHGRLIYDVELGDLGISGMYTVRTETLAHEAILPEQANADGAQTQLVRRNGSAQFLDTESMTWHRSQDSLVEDEPVLSQVAGPFIRNSHIVYFQSQVTGWVIYHNLRVDAHATMRQAAVTRRELSVAPDGQNLINVLHTLYTGERDFKQSVNTAMRAAFGADYDELVFPPAADQRVQLRVRWKTLKREQSAADLSDGTLRFLFLLAVLANPAPPPLIAIDEPETGLHPSMMPLIAEYAVDAAKRTQVIFTTHSDQFLDAFGDTKPTTTVAKWAAGETTLHVLDGEELGYWLQQYSLGRLFRSGELENMA